MAAISLLELLSGMQHPDLKASDQAAKQKTRELVTIIASLVTTLLTFIFTMYGAGSALRGAKRAAHRVKSWREGSVPAAAQRRLERSFVGDDRCAQRGAVHPMHPMYSEGAYQVDSQVLAAGEQEANSDQLK